MGLCSLTAVSFLLIAFSLSMPGDGKPALLGGKQSADASSDDVAEAAQQAVALLNHGEAHKLQGAPLNGLLQLVKVKSVTKQVVAGTNYDFTLTVKDASGSETDLSVTLWSRPWLAAKNDVHDPAWKLTRVERVGGDDANA